MLERTRQIIGTTFITLVIIVLLIICCTGRCSAQVDITKRTVTTDSLRSRQDTLWFTNKKGSLVYFRTHGDTLYFGDASGEKKLSATGIGSVFANSGLRKDGDTIKLDNDFDYPSFDPIRLRTYNLGGFGIDASNLSGGFGQGIFGINGVITMVTNFANGTKGFSIVLNDTSNILFRKIGLGKKNVGIFTDNPVETLDVNGNIKGDTTKVLCVNTNILKLDATQDTTVTAIVGRIVFKASDTHFYGCRKLTGQKWYQLDQ
jgi:hypothetical protein